MLPGYALPFLLKEVVFKENLIKIFKNAKSVVVYRTSPS